MTIAVMGVLLFGIGFGVLNCFFGAKFLRAMLFLYGFIIGFLVGFILTITLDPLVSILISLAVAMVLGLVAYSIYNLGIFMIGGASAALILLLILYSFEVDLTKWYSVFSVLGVFIAAGIVTLKFKRIVIIVCTAINGGTNLAMFGGALIMYFGEITSATFENLEFSIEGASNAVQSATNNFLAMYGVIFIIASIVLAAGGAVVQFMYTSKKAKYLNK